MELLTKLALMAALAAPVASWAQSNTFEGHYARPLSDVLTDMSRRFGVVINVDVDTAGVVLEYADSRIRPYSVEESLNNVLKPLDLRWERKGQRKYVVRRFDYPRRTFDEGRRMVEYLNTLYDDREAWEARRDTLATEVRARLGIDSLLAARVPAEAIYGETRQYDGYSVTNYRLETLPGEWVCGSVYAPVDGGQTAPKNKRRRQTYHSRPLIICPNGHFANGRYNDEQQLRKATLARMGAVVVDYDLVGWGESSGIPGVSPANGNDSIHRTARANVMQLVNGVSILDAMLGRRDVDPERVGLNGGSGGGTQVVYLSLLDDRYAAACPTVNLAAHFDGGCPCESGMAATLAAGGTCHPEMAACFAPRPMCVISDGGDWTAQVPEVEYPYLQRVYGFYGAADQVSNVHLPDERHDFGPNKRRAVYDFFADVFGLDPGMVDEGLVTIETPEMMRSDH